MSLVQQALATDGLWLLLLGVILAGLVRGFTGFGTGMVYLPIAAQVLPPVWTLVTLIMIDILGPLPALPRAIREGHTRDVIRLGLAALIAVPAGAWILTSLPGDIFRYALSILTLALLICLVAGFRYSGTIRRSLIYGIGLVSGLLAGALGLGGPPVIMLYMARPLPPSVIRASTLLFLFLTDLMLLGTFGLRGLLAAEPIVIGLFLALPYLVAVMAGTAIFDPARERVYRWTAYAIIAGSAIAGLPLLY